MNNPLEPRYDSKPTQPKDLGEMSRDEEDALFDATLERDEVADMVWEAVIDEISPNKSREIVRVLFRRESLVSSMADFAEASRLIHRACHSRVHEIVDGEEHNTDMGKD